MAAFVAVTVLQGCNGIFEGIYDEPQSGGENDYGYITSDNKKHTGRIYVDATDYGMWHYVDLHNTCIVSQPVDEDAPQNWDFAIHRYDAKTNGGAVAECGTSDLSKVQEAGFLPDNEFTSDIWTTDKMISDMSQMMQGIILYASDYYNPVLSGWMEVNTSSMPPVYKMSGKVYMLSLPDGSFVALKLSNFMSDAAVKGFLTIDYIYPVQL